MDTQEAHLQRDPLRYVEVSDSEASGKKEPCRNAGMQTELFRVRFYPGYQVGEGDGRLGEAFTMISSEEYYDELGDRREQEEYYSHLATEGGLCDGVEFGARNFHLLSKLVSLKTPKARVDNLYSWYDRWPDGTLHCIYSNKLLSDAKGNYPRSCKFNEEHSFPQSYQHGSGAGTGRDAHHIFACDQHLNGSRGNKAFGAVAGVESLMANEGYAIFKESQEDGGRKLLLPHYNRGMLARGSLYTIVSYPGILFEQQIGRNSLAWLIKTAAEEPVSIWERHRNQAIFRVQGNRNPFVDHPSWVKLVDFHAGLVQGSVPQGSRADKAEICLMMKAAKQKQRETEKARKKSMTLDEKALDKKERQVAREFKKRLKAVNSEKGAEVVVLSSEDSEF